LEAVPDNRRRRGEWVLPRVMLPPPRAARFHSSQLKWHRMVVTGARLLSEVVGKVAATLWRRGGSRAARLFEMGVDAIQHSIVPRLARILHL